MNIGIVEMLGGVGWANLYFALFIASLMIMAVSLMIIAIKI